MIINFLVTGLLGILGWLTAFLPAGTPWAPDVSPVSSALGSLYAVDAYLPITEAFVCVGIALTILQVRQAITLGVWIWKRFRG